MEASFARRIISFSQKKILNGGKPIALRLTKLPEGYGYSDFGISGTQLFVAWEESEFYKTGRAGAL